MMCEECGLPLESRRKRFCTDKCRYRYRDRTKVGIPLDAPHYSRAA